MDDILFSIPEYCDDCKTWHLMHVWGYGSEPAEEEYSICDSDGNHDPLDAEGYADLFTRYNDIWRDYWQWVVDTGTDPVGDLSRVRSTYVRTATFEVYLKNWLCAPDRGLLITKWRRGTRGPWLHREAMPQILADYLNVQSPDLYPFYPTTGDVHSIDQLEALAAKEKGSRSTDWAIMARPDNLTRRIRLHLIERLDRSPKEVAAELRHEARTRLRKDRP